MSKKISVEDKIYAVNLYLNKKISIQGIATLYGVKYSTARQWIRNYESIGMDAFVINRSYYSKELKLQAVMDYLTGQGSQSDICKKYGIRARSELQYWIKMYNSHDELKASRTGGYTIMIKGRKTTFDERVEIVQYCIAHERNYSETAEKYQISYHQARNYLIKYEMYGVKGLQDNRGHRKPEAEMSELERLRAENRILKAEKERAEMEASFLKKLAEIERRRG